MSLFGKTSSFKVTTIPESLTELEKKVKNHPEDPLIKDARDSIYQKRNSSTARILLLGDSDSEKEAVIGHLFLDQSRLSHLLPCDQRSIIEITFPYQQSVKERSKTYNLNLTLLIPPDFGDTTSDLSDPRVLGTLEDLLEKEKFILTSLLFFTPFDEPRFALPNSTFIRMLKAVKTLRQTKVSLWGTSIIFILTKYSRVSKVDRINPQYRKEEFESIIKQHTSIKYPIILFADNRPDDLSFDSWVLGNGQVYPQNLLDGILQTIRLNDPMGARIIQLGFDQQKIAVPKIEVKPLIKETDSRVIKYLNLFENSSPGPPLTVEDTVQGTMPRKGPKVIGVVRPMIKVETKKSKRPLDLLSKNIKIGRPFLTGKTKVT